MTPRAASAAPERTLPNPAAQFCAQAGGKARVIVSEAGEAALCDFDAGSIEEWTLFRYAAGQTALAIRNYLTHPSADNADTNEDDAAYCAFLGGEALRRVTHTGDAVRVCRFEDNSVIEQHTLRIGPDGSGHARLNAVLGSCARGSGGSGFDNPVGRG